MILKKLDKTVSKISSKILKILIDITMKNSSEQIVLTINLNVFISKAQNTLYQKFSFPNSDIVSYNKGNNFLTQI